MIYQDRGRLTDFPREPHAVGHETRGNKTPADMTGQASLTVKASRGIGIISDLQLFASLSEGQASRSTSLESLFLINACRQNGFYP
jgi:hypothetical protein